MSNSKEACALQELAVQLLLKQIDAPAWNQSFERYWQSLPKWGTLYSKENWLLDQDHLELLQDPYLVRSKKPCGCARAEQAGS